MCAKINGLIFVGNIKAGVVEPPYETVTQVAADDQRMYIALGIN